MDINYNTLIQRALEYRSTSNPLLALKYAMMAASSTYSPTAYICCVIGDIYLDINNYRWAEFWFKMAIGNNNVSFNEEELDTDYSIKIPELKLVYTYNMLGEYDKAREYNDMVLKIYPEDEIALNNKEKFEHKEKETE